MTATVIQLNQVTRLRMRIKRAYRSLKPLKTAEPKRESIPQFDEPDVLMSFGRAEQWLDCVRCFHPIAPADTCAIDHNSGRCWCSLCWEISE